MESAEVPWHYNARCKTCDFVDKCRKDAEGSIAMIPYMSIDNAEYLKTAIKYWKINDLDDLNDHNDGDQGNSKTLEITLSPTKLALDIAKEKTQQ